MSRFLVSIFLVAMSLLAGSRSLAATLYTYTNGGSTGLWNAAGTWTTDPSGLSLTGSAVPNNGDAVVILNGFTVVLSANVASTGLIITINNGGTLDLATFTFGTTINTLTGSGTLKMQSGSFPAITTNLFASNAASGATVNYYDFAGTIPVSINYPHLTFSNSTVANNTISIANTTANTFTVGGNFITQTTGTGTLAVVMGTAASNVISLTINGNVTIGANTSWGVGAFVASHSVNMLGNMTNNGTVQFSNTALYVTPASTNGVVSTSFIGATDRTLACNGITNLYSLTVDKGLSSTNILSVTSTNTANLAIYTRGQLITLANGTLKLGVNIFIDRMYGTGSTNYDIGTSAGATPMLWIDGATVNTNSSAIAVYGKFRISAGSFTTTGGEGSVIRLEGQYIIEGGTFTTEKFRPSTETGTHRGSFTMTGGTFNATGTGSNGAYARFSLPFPDQVFIMSGGIINVSNPQSTLNGGIHIGCNASNYLVTGGVVNAILSGSAAFYNVSSTAPFYDFNITRTGGTPTTVRLAAITGVSNTDQTARPLTVLHDFTIDGTNSPVFNASGLSVTVGHDFTINAGGTYTPSTNTTIFNGTGAQSLANNGTLGLYNLTMNKPSGVLTLAGSATTYAVTQTLTLTSGVLNDGGKIIQVTGNIHNEATHGGTGNITLNGVTPQTISGDGNGIFGNLILNNPSNPGANATADLAVSGVLTLAGSTNSLFDINQNLLSLNSTSSTVLVTTGTGFSSAKMIRTSGLQSDNGIRKAFNDLSPFTFAFGVGTSYTPAIIQLTSAPTTYGTITARPVNSRHQFVLAGNTNNLAWYWKVNSAGFTGIGPSAVSQTFQYIESSVAPVGDDVTYVPASYNPTSWSVISDLTQVNETTNVVSFSSIGFIDGEFTAGRPSAFGAIKVFYSKRNGNWSDVGAGTTPWSNVSHSGADATTAPVVGDHVFIGDGSTFNHVITITSNGRAAGGLAINTGSTLDVGIYTGHNFGTFENSPITGNGTLRISSASATAEFPAGDFGNFIRATGGTVEYYTTGAQDFTIPLTSSAPTSLALISYKNLSITPTSGHSILMPNQDLRVYGTMNVQGASSTGIARLNSTTSRTLEINGNLNVASGTLQFENVAAQNLEVNGNITIGATGIFNLTGTGTAVANLLSLDGNLTNHGVFDMANNTRITNVTFSGSSSTSITGTGATTDFNILTVSKGTSAATVLDVNATAFTLSGATIPLVLNTGTFRLTSAQTVTFADGVDFSIPSTAGLSANGGTLQLTGGDGFDLLLSGTLEVLNGTVNIGTMAADNSIEYAPTGQPTIFSSGGNLNVRSQIRRSFASTQGALLYNQSGSGVVSVGMSSASTTNRGVFEILNPGSSFSMTGGTLQIARALGTSTIADLYLQPSSYTVTGGTIEIGASGMSQVIDINSIIPVYNVSVTGATATPNTARLENNGLTLRGSLNINAGNIFNANTFAVNIAGDFTNLNASNSTGTTVGGYRAGSVSQTTTFNGSVNNQNFTGVSGNISNFGNLVISNTFASGTVTLQPNTNLRINGALIFSSGSVAGGGNTVTALSTVSNSVTQTNTAGGSITLAGATNQLITGNGSGKFGNVILNNASGATFGANQEITGVLTFTNGLLQIGSFSLNLSNTSLGAISNATSARYIVTSGNLSDGGVTKAFAANVTTGNFIYPIGVSGKYTPADYTISTGVLGGTITIKPVNSKHPSATGSGVSFINYYWSVSNSVIILSALTHTYMYTLLDESAGGTPTDYRDARFKGGAWTIGVSAGNPNITSRVITFTNTDVAGDYTAGEPTAFVNPTIYTSHASGSWESEGSIWTPIPPGTGIGPPAGSFVVISAGDVITMTGNSKRMATLEVLGRLHLGNTNGHDFGTVTTSGGGDRTIQLQSSTFPSGDFTNFTAAGGGTVEYDGTVILPTQNTYNNLTFTSAGTKTLPNADLTINGSVTVFAGTATNAVNNRSIVLVSSTGDFTNNGVFTAGSGIILIGRNLINSGAAAVFNAGTLSVGGYGLQVAGNLNNNSGATFLMNADSLGVRGAINNSATFTGSSGPVRVTGNLNNTGGTFTSSTGFVTVSGSLVNNTTYTAGAGATTVKGSYTNSGAAAVHNANANTMTVRGNFTNSSSATFNTNSGSILTQGNWINSATFNAGIGSSVTFNSASAQTLTGSTTFYNLTRSAGGSLTLNSDITATNLLTLTSGNIITGANTVNLTNITAQSVTGYSATSFIDGRLSTSFPNTASASRIYPVGKGSIYRPVTITQTAASTLPIVRVEMINTIPSGTYPTTVGILSESRYYAIDQISGTMNSPTVGLSFNTNGVADENVFLAGNAHILRSTNPSGPWTDEGGSGVFTPAAPAGNATSGVTSIINQTYFALGYQNAPLPISLATFKGVLSNDVVELSWSTFTEKNNAYFTIERSVDGINFEAVGFVDGAGNSQKTLYYHLTDANPLPDVSYYRLKQTDYDDRFTYSGLAKIVNPRSERAGFVVYPVPSRVSDPIMLKLVNSTNVQADLSITDIAGRVFYTGSVTLTDELNLNDLNLNSPLERGIYLVHVVAGSLNETKRILLY